jgi:hypothetical protein
MQRCFPLDFLRYVRWLHECIAKQMEGPAVISSIISYAHPAPQTPSTINTLLVLYSISKYKVRMNESPSHSIKCCIWRAARP